MAAWPPSLPVNPLAASYKPQFPELVLRTAMDRGAAFQRRVATAGPTLFPGLQFVLTRAQVDTFQTFWNVDINGGAAPFDFDVPSDWPLLAEAGTGQTFRITAPYRLTARSRGIRWTLEVDMEMVP